MPVGGATDNELDKIVMQILEKRVLLQQRFQSFHGVLRDRVFTTTGCWPGRTGTGEVRSDECKVEIEGIPSGFMLDAKSYYLMSKVKPGFFTMQAELKAISRVRGTFIRRRLLRCIAAPSLS
jgi:hypothetical protein